MNRVGLPGAGICDAREGRADYGRTEDVSLTCPSSIPPMRRSICLLSTRRIARPAAARALHTWLVRNAIGDDAPTTRQTFDVVHPGTGITAHQVQRSTAADLDRAVDVVHGGLPAWRATPLARRKEIMNRAAAIVEDKASGWADRLLAANVAETSVTQFWAGLQLTMVPEAIRALTSAADEALAETTVSHQNREQSACGVLTFKTSTSFKGSHSAHVSLSRRGTQCTFSLCALSSPLC